MTIDIPAIILERAEAEEMYEFEGGVPEALREKWGVASTRLGGGVVLAMRDDVSDYWSKALGFGFDEPVTLSLMEQVIAFYRERGVRLATVQLAPSVVPNDWPAICEALGLEPSDIIRKLGCDIETAVKASESVTLDDGLTVGPVTPDEAAAWADVMPRAMGMPHQGMQDMAATSVVRDGWHPFAVRESGSIVATATLRVQGEVGSLFAGCTLTEARGRGAQSALIAARIRAAQDAGCRWLVVETFDEPAGTHNSSYHNLIRSGFTLQYGRQNWIWRNPAVSAGADANAG
ncbi:MULTISPECIES: GNAT family N-acetyltransferase [unclassified Streptomyces]|uniref:GNAT family N-acetyltransferase n=1 Tax=unclassified Streptomyces TaxID=2593676 RepID=UPI0029A0151E|nr:MULTISPECIES: GNAT family N-acetyltransferase [unclassified Streptomyces]MDX3771187.1 GNAT family N-acetyltransferase [Streptomyces sp. AK08-01B]MDX3820773.1 GNAT family N-acetyltransferase [Streptomyces sp. AK08-01A]